MIHKAEIYSRHQLVAKVKIFIEENGKEITVISRQRNEFLIFYPQEDFSIHYMDDNGTVFIFHVSFKEIKMMRTAVYYVFTIHTINTFHNLRNTTQHGVEYHALLSNFKLYEEVQIIELSDKEMKILSRKPLEVSHFDIFYYIGRRKYAFLAEICWSKQEVGLYVYELFIYRKEVI
ncbi:hypothetical protein CN918_31975 [Priestia megaterium]|nr:hypothetical protein CN918_31975 [Priestia megaterium]